jgi:lysine-ketoglutarate reductase/saccharopine dehydrogenase-like protein (TIGR00300 family)
MLSCLRYVSQMVSEIVELRGHIIDSLILPKVLDVILTRGGNFTIDEIKIGRNRADQSYARIEVTGPSHEALDDLILRLRQHGAEVVEKADAQLAPAPTDGVFPTDFYVTTNQQTFVRIDGKEIEVRPTIMDSGIVVDRTDGRASAVKFYELHRGMDVVVGHQGIKVAPLQRATSHTDLLEFMGSNVSVERPKSAVIWEIARELKRAREKRGKILVVAGSAVVQTGASEHLEKLIEWGYVNLLFAGNALAVHDIAGVLFDSSRDANPNRFSLSDHGHENQMRAINTIRETGGIVRAVEKGVLQRGIMRGCIQHGVDFILAGSIRDEGPLPEVITDAVEAQKAMREKISGVTIALMMSTMLHSMAVGSLLPASVKTFCVDINPAAISKLTDRGTFQAFGLVTDIEPFLRELTGCLETLRASEKSRAQV